MSYSNLSWAENIIGADVVELKGGRVEVVPVLEGRSTDSILEKIRHAGEDEGAAKREKGS